MPGSDRPAQEVTGLTLGKLCKRNPQPPVGVSVDACRAAQEDRIVEPGSGHPDSGEPFGQGEGGGRGRAGVLGSGVVDLVTGAGNDNRG